MGKFVLGKVDYSADYAKQYEEGDRDPELILNYVKALNKSNKSSSKVANEYLRSFTHPISGEKIDLEAKIPDESLWNYFAEGLEQKA